VIQGLVFSAGSDATYGTFPLDTRHRASLNSVHARKEVVQWTVAINPARWLTPRLRPQRIDIEAFQLDSLLNLVPEGFPGL